MAGEKQGQGLHQPQRARCRGKGRGKPGAHCLVMIAGGSFEEEGLGTAQAEYRLLRQAVLPTT